ncbi:hypothetical protein [Micromonospora sp. NPDC002575]|uniref:hypothetical protein n=1 Tax=Micromonospora sp. NPDC002575 TaxID=3364222 RepID=UPI0036AF5F33
MDKLSALRIYSAVYLAQAAQLATLLVARQWMETMPFRTATQEDLEQHARMAAAWASRGYMPKEAAPLIADGITAATVGEMEDHAADSVGGHEALAALRAAELIGTGQLIGPDRLIRVQDPVDPTHEIITIRDED